MPGVVDAVTGHHHPAVAFLQCADGGGLVLGSLLGVDLVDPDASADGLGGAAVVAGDHHRPLDPGGLERGDGGRRLVSQRVGHSEHRLWRAVDDEHHGGGAGAFQPFDPVAEGVQGKVAFCHQLRGPDEDPTIAVAAFDAGPDEGGHVGDLCRRHVPVEGTVNDGPGQGVLAGPFDPGGERKRLVLVDAGGSEDLDQLGAAVGEGAGLVERRDLHGSKVFEDDAALDEDAVAAGVAMAAT